MSLDLKRKSQSLEYERADLRRQLEIAEGDRLRMTEEWKELSAAKRASEDARVDLERDVARLNSRLELLHHQLDSKDEAAGKNSALLESAEKSRRQTEERLQQYVAAAEALREKLAEASAEIARGNEAMQTMQTEIRSLRDKIRVKNEVIKRQVSQCMR